MVSGREWIGGDLDTHWESVSRDVEDEEENEEKIREKLMNKSKTHGVSAARILGILAKLIMDVRRAGHR